MQVKSIAECSKGSILQYFWPSFKLPFVIEIFVLYIFEWLFTQVLLYMPSWLHIKMAKFKTYIHLRCKWAQR